MSNAFFDFATHPRVLDTVVTAAKAAPGRMTKADAAAYGAMCGVTLALSALQALTPSERAEVLAEFATVDPLGPKYFPRDVYLALVRKAK